MTATRSHDGYVTIAYQGPGVAGAGHPGGTAIVPSALQSCGGLAASAVRSSSFTRLPVSWGRNTASYGDAVRKVPSLFSGRMVMVAVRGDGWIVSWLCCA